jgi:putative hemolysin
MFRTLLVFIFTLTACAAPKQAPRPPNIGKANPAAQYCLQKGGERVPVQSPQGVRTECKLPGGEVVDEWELWRREHPQSGS